MDDRHFDALTRILTTGDSRRRLLAFLATLPLVGGVLGLYSLEDAEAKDRRRRRKKRHKRRRARRSGGKGCRPKSRTKVCAGKCGPVKNRKTCGKRIDCGPCECTPACEECFTCQGVEGAPGTCVPQEAGTPCGDGNVCCGGTCQECCDNAQCGDPAAPVCVGGACTTCTTSDQCDSGSVCWNGACVCGDVCASGCQFTSLQAAVNALPAGSTIRLCAGTYSPVTIGKNVTLIGVGDGDNPASNTILDGQNSQRVVFIDPGVTVTLQDLRVTRGFVSDTEGAGIRNNGNLTMTGCTITDNHAEQPTPVSFGSAGGIRNGASSTLTMTNCTISDNTAGIDSGGILLLQGSHAFTNCTFSGNTADSYAAAVFLNNGGSATFTGCTFGPDNNAPDGAIVVWNDSQLTLDATTVFENNGTTVGGIFNVSGVVILQNGSTVSGNTPNNCFGAGTFTGDGCAP